MYLFSHLFVLLVAGVVVAKLIELLVDEHLTRIARYHLIAVKVACYWSVSVGGKHCPELFERLEESVYQYIYGLLRSAKHPSNGFSISARSICFSYESARAHGYIRLIPNLPDDKEMFVFPDKIVFPDKSELIYSDPRLVQLGSSRRAQLA